MACSVAGSAKPLRWKTSSDFQREAQPDPVGRARPQYLGNFDRASTKAAALRADTKEDPGTEVVDSEAVPAV